MCVGFFQAIFCCHNISLKLDLKEIKHGLRKIREKFKGIEELSIALTNVKLQNSEKSESSKKHEDEDNIDHDS